MATPVIAANAYASLARLDRSGRRRLAKAAGGRRAGGRASAPCSRTRSARSRETGRKSDAQTQAMAAGKANVVDVVTAVAETEVAIEALVAVRDKVIQAYEEIMRMPI